MESSFNEKHSIISKFSSIPWLASNNHIGFKRLIRVQQQLYNKDQIVRIGPKRDSRKMKFLPCADGNNCRHPAQSNNVKAKTGSIKSFYWLKVFKNRPSNPFFGLF